MTQQATFGSGCFWCSEAVFKRVKGVTTVTSGYAGGKIEQPSYEQVSNGDTDHTEVVQIVFNPDVISYKTLVEIFFGTHNPTTLNRQGNDVGTQYRSVIFYHTDEQKKIAEEVKTQLESEKIFNDPIVTAIEPFKNFYEAEDYHKDYFERNQDQPYCRAVIDPKIAKFRERFQQYLK